MGLSKYEKQCYSAYKNFVQVRNFEKEIPNSVYGLEITLPDKPEDYTSITNYGLPREQRKFPYHDWEYVKRIDNLPSSDPERKAFIDKEWKRRKEGFWWYNGDFLEWIPGHYYMTLQYWKIPIEDKGGALGNPKFVDMNRDMNLAIWDSKADENTMGLAYVGCRRSGKTVQGIANGS